MQDAYETELVQDDILMKRRHGVLESGKDVFAKHEVL